MTMTSVGWMRYPTNDTSFPSGGGTQAMDAAGDLYAFIFRVPVTGTISNVHYRVVTNSAANMTLRTELRTVDATTGLPDAAGTLYGSSTSITTTTFATNTNYTAAVNCTGATVGDLVALVFDISAFTSGSFTLLTRPVTVLIAGNFPYNAANTTGSTAVGSTNISGFGLEYSGGVFYQHSLFSCTSAPITTATVTNSGVTRRGNRLRPPVKMRAIGIWASLDADGDCLLQLRLQSDDSLLATATIDKDVRGTTGAGAFGEWLFDSGATVTLAAGTDYYAVVTGNSATATTCYQIASIPSNAMLDQLSGGKNCYGTSYNAGYTDVDTSRYAIGLVVDQYDDGAGGAGGGAHILGGTVVR
jgi:hypothetical protein